MALNYLQQPKIKQYLLQSYTSKFEGLVFQKEKYYISSSKKQQKHNFQLKESIKNISLIDYGRMDYNYLYIQVVSAKSLAKLYELSIPIFQMVDKLDPFIKYTLSQSSTIYEGQTETILNSQNPLWNHQRLIKLDNTFDPKKPLNLNLKVYDYDFEKNTLIGEKDVTIMQILMFPGKWFNQILFMEMKREKTNQQVYVQMQFRPKNLVDYSKAPKRLL